MLTRMKADNDNGDTNAPDPIEVRALIWKQDLRIVPLAAAIYLLCFLDRSNIG